MKWLVREPPGVEEAMDEDLEIVSSQILRRNASMLIQVG